MAQFRALKQNAHGAGPDAALVDNYRPVQALNGRTVFVTYTTSAASQSGISTGRLLLALIVALTTLAGRY